MVDEDRAAAPTDPIDAHVSGVHFQSISPDGHTLATGSIARHDPAVRPPAPNGPLGAPLPGVPNQPVAAEFTPDGAYLLAIAAGGRAYRWDGRPASWRRHACRIAGRALTRAEWRDVLPEHEYTPACAG